MSQNKVRLFFTVCVVLMLVIATFSRKVVRMDDYSLEFMGTNTHIIVLAKGEKAGKVAIAKAKQELSDIEKIMSYHDPNSELNHLNGNAFRKPVVVSEQLYSVIERGWLYSKLSEGKFDITIGPLVDLWKNAKSMPSEEKIRKAKEKVGYENLKFNESKRTIKFNVRGMKIDLGGIAKGYAIDRAVEVLKQNGCKGGLVDIGGDLRCFGQSPDRSGYTVALQNPKAIENANENSYLLKFKFDNMAVATSGDYQRYVEVDGERISHIIDPETKSGAGKYSSVTVITKEAVDADALATMFSLIDANEAIEIVDGLDGVETLLIEKKGGKVLKSAGIGAYIVE